jgi:hypothetical protein
MTRQESILSYVPEYRIRRLRYLASILQKEQEIAILQHQVDKIEERFDEVGLSKDGLEK